MEEEDDKEKDDEDEEKKKKKNTDESKSRSMKMKNKRKDNRDLKPMCDNEWRHPRNFDKPLSQMRTRATGRKRLWTMACISLAIASWTALCAI